MTVEWGQTSPADFDRHLTGGKTRKAGPAGMVPLFPAATPTLAEPETAPMPGELPGQGELDLSGDELS